MKHKGFDEEKFIIYLQQKFETPVFKDSIVIEIIENVVEYAHKHKHISKNQFCEFVSEILDQVEFGEVAMFMEDKCLTEYGICEKNKWLEKVNEDDLEIAKKLINDFCLKEYDEEANFNNLKEVNIAYTTDETGKKNIQVSVNLIELKMNTYINNELKQEIIYNTFEEMIEELKHLNFDCLTSMVF